MPPTPGDDDLALFLAAPLFAEVPLELRRLLAGVLELRRAEAGELLLEEGRPNDRISFLIEGSVQIVRNYPGPREELVATLTAPAMFGETSFFRPKPPIVNVRATTSVRALTLDHAGHERLRHEAPRAAEALALVAVQVLAERFDMLDRRVSDLFQKHGADAPETTEWARFRAQLFEESSL